MDSQKLQDENKALKDRIKKLEANMVIANDLILRAYYPTDHQNKQKSNK